MQCFYGIFSSFILLKWTELQWAAERGNPFESDYITLSHIGIVNEICVLKKFKLLILQSAISNTERHTRLRI